MKNRDIYGRRKSFLQIGKRRLFSGVAIGSTAFALFAAGHAKAQIVTYTTSGLTGSTASVNPTAASGASPSTLSRTGTTANSGSNTFASTANLYTSATPDLSQKYEGYTVAPTSTTTSVLFITAFTADVSGSGTAPNSLAIGYSTDGFATSNVATGSVTATDTVNTYTPTTSLITNDTVSVRIQNYGTTGVSGTAGSGGSFRLGSSTNPASTVLGSVVTTANGAIALTANTEVRTTTTITLGGVVSGAFNLTKNEAGTLALTNADTYSGTTSVTSGTLQIGTAGSINASTAVSVTGTGALTLQSATALADTGSLTLVSGTTLNLNAASGTTETIGSLVLDGTTEAAGTYTAAQLMGFDSGITFSSLNGETLTIAAVPEPATCLAGALMVGAAGWSQRRRLRASFSRAARSLQAELAA